MKLASNLPITRQDLESLRYESFRLPHSVVLSARITESAHDRFGRIQSYLHHSVFSKSEIIEMALIRFENDLIQSGYKR